MSRPAERAISAEHRRQPHAVGPEQRHHATQVGRAHGRVGRTLRRLVLPPPPPDRCSSGRRPFVPCRGPRGHADAARTGNHSAPRGPPLDPRGARPGRYGGRVTGFLSPAPAPPARRRTRRRRDRHVAGPPRAHRGQRAVDGRVLPAAGAGHQRRLRPAPGPRDERGLGAGLQLVLRAAGPRVHDRRHAQLDQPGDLRRHRGHHQLPRGRLPPPAARGRGAPAGRGAAGGDGPDRPRPHRRRPAGRGGRPRGGARARGAALRDPARRPPAAGRPPRPPDRADPVARGLHRADGGGRQRPRAPRGGSGAARRGAALGDPGLRHGGRRARGGRGGARAG